MTHELFKKIFIYTIACIVVFSFSSRAYYKMTDDFRIANITEQIPFSPELEVKVLTPTERKNLDLVLSQPYHYLGKGGQTYAFVSEDDRYVLKFFKFKHHRPRFFAKLLPSVFPFRQVKEKHIQHCAEKFWMPFYGYKLAFDQHRVQSRIIALHLNLTQDDYGCIRVTDKLGFSRWIDLDSVVFVVQEKGENFRHVLNHLIKKNKFKKVRTHVRKIVDLYFEESQKGIFDRDGCVMTNTGFSGEDAMRIDAGQICFRKGCTDETFVTLKKRVERWLNKAHPKHKERVLGYLEERINELVT